ncbi:hypothetical protein PUNSTDRAFT_53465 [Punctularia strigosozonata HHB-11173 SS5]|uniref:uncharacterized protein n=1 Tax=Punctularia strigosozonata (strain HHB-11173) TaxID=741275 RepID=UPI0004417037|nr:uncharacterized protein PUNSTDRAFT_53465 [Punctularia strigosozonata HHB-11173 SS5]EIN07065.1 hypothetical protein PUNSTDRAFT_53465 [Punctularia strigosozonata HHB-11173 SS5]
MALPPSTANWHWKNKNVGPWAKSWFERELTAISVQGEGDETVGVSEVTEVDGDVEIGQRKSKLLTIYDCKIRLEWAGTASDGTEVKGRLTIPEVSHEVTLDGLSDYTYEWSLTTASSPTVDALYKLAKTRLPAALEAKFAEFPVAMLETHGKDLQVGTPSASGSSTPVSSGPATAASTTPSYSVAPAKPAAPKAKKTNTTTVTVEATFAAPADELFSLFTDEKRIPQWTRAPAVSGGKPDTEYSLFGGGVKGKYVSLTPSKEIVQTWALSNPSWPSGHQATLTTTLDQSSDSTKVMWSLAGVPIGMEDEITQNINGYYVHGLKSIGYVHLVTQRVPSYPTSSLRSTSPQQPSSTEAPTLAKTSTVILIIVTSLVAAFAVPLLSSR